MSATPALLAAAAGVGFGHAILPDHWVPLAVVGRTVAVGPAVQRERPRGALGFGTRGSKGRFSQMGSRSRTNERMTWRDLCCSEEYRGRWVALDNVRYDPSTSQPIACRA